MPIIPCRACGRHYTTGENEPAGLCPACREVPTLEPLPSMPPLSAFPSLPGYEILGELGRGGMGVVYQARQVGLNRVVALKVILVGAHASSDERARFRNEAETIARLRHPNIVQVYELGEWSVPGTGALTPFLSMEFCGGGSLDKRLKTGPLPPPLAAGLVECLARAIHGAHEKRVVHRDLKPANILFDDNGVPKVTDFGLAKKLDEQGHTQSGAVMGTPSYMAPEQAQGKSKQTSPATDVWALGAILFECLTGRPPFAGETPLDTIMAVVGDPVPPMSLELPPGLSAICQRCLSKKPQDRYPTAQALAEDLRRYLSGQRVAAFGLPSEREQRSARGLVGLAVMAALALLAIIAAAAVWMSRGEPTSRDGGGPLTGKNFQPKFRLPTQVGEVERFEIDKKGAVGVAFSQGGTRMYTLGKTGVAAVWDLEDRMLARELRAPGGRGASLALSRHGESVLTATEEGGTGFLRLLDSSNGEEVIRAGTKGMKPRRAVFGDERWLLACAEGDSQVHLWAAKGAVAPRELKGHKAAVHDVAASATQALSASADGTVRLWDLERGQPIRVFTNDPPTAVTSCVFSADGKSVLGGCGDGKIRIWDVADGRLLDTLHGHKAGVGRILVMKEHRYALSAAGDGEVLLWNLASHSLMSRFGSHGGAVTDLALTPDGRHFATASADGTVRIWGLPALRD